MKIGLCSYNGSDELKEVGYQGYLVTDHIFGIDADDQDYPLISRAWQVGHIRGLLQCLGD